MAIILPTSPAPRTMVPRVIQAGFENSPEWGGPDQRGERMGDRYAFDVTLPPQRYLDALDWGDINRWGDTCVLSIRQPGLDTGAPGSPLVNGAGQLGTTLVLDGFTPNYVMRKYQWLTVITGSRRYCYRAAAQTIANGGGQMSLPLATMIRVSPADNAVVEIADPKVEGFVTVDENAWTISAEDGGLVRLKFTIREVE